MPVMQTTLQDESHLNLLSVFHYVIGGLCLLGIGLLIMHFLILTFFFRMTPVISYPPVVMSSAPAEVVAEAEIPASADPLVIPVTPAATAPLTHITSHAPFPGFPKEMMAVFIIFYVVVGAIMAAVAVANFMSGGFIKKRKNKTFSLVVAGINCLQMPFGTVLGVLTIIVLMRPSVQSGYEGNQPA